MAYIVGKAAQTAAQTSGEQKKIPAATSSGYFVGKAAQHAGAEIPTDVPKEPSMIKEILQDPLKTLIVKPGVRVGQTIANLGVQAFGDEEMKRRADIVNTQTANFPAFGGIEIEPVKPGFEGVKQAVGEGLKAGSYLVGTGGGMQAGKEALKTTLGTAMKTGAKYGAQSGALYGAGQALEEGGGVGDVARQGITGAVAGTVFGGAIPPVLVGGQRAIQTVSNISTKGVRGTAEQQVIKGIRKEVDQMLAKTRGVTSKTQLGTRKGTDYAEIISEPSVFRGLKVDSNSRIDPTDAIQLIRERRDSVQDVLSETLPEIDRFTPRISREALRQKALAGVEGKGLPLDEASLARDINAQIDALPEKMSITEIDKIRARARQSARDAKGLQKRDSEYTAIENAARDTVFDATENLPFDTNQEFIKARVYVKDLINTEEFLDRTMRGQTVRGGRLTNLVGRVVGAIAGSKGGPFASFVGNEVGGRIADIIVNNQLGSAMKMRLIREITDDPRVLVEAQNVLMKAKAYTPKQITGQTTREAIENPRPRQSTQGTDTIFVAPRTSTKENIGRVVYPKEYQPFGVSQGMGMTPAQRSNINKMTNTQIIDDTIAQTTPKEKNEAGQTVNALPAVTNQDVKRIAPTANFKNNHVQDAFKNKGSNEAFGFVMPPLAFGVKTTTPQTQENDTLNYERKRTPFGFPRMTETPKINVEKLKRAIAENETGGMTDEKRGAFSQPSGVSKYGKAIGKFQIIEDELKRYAERFTGRKITADEFRRNSALQEKYMEGKIRWLNENYGWGAKEILAAHRGGMAKPDEIQRIMKERKGYVDKAMRTYESQ